MMKIEVTKGYDGAECCDIKYVEKGKVRYVKISEPIGALKQCREEFIKARFGEEDK